MASEKECQLQTEEKFLPPEEARGAKNLLFQMKPGIRFSFTEKILRNQEGSGLTLFLCFFFSIFVFYLKPVKYILHFA